MRHSVNLLNGIRITIVCEGIETLAELEVLSDVGWNRSRLPYRLPGLQALSYSDLSELRARR